jgi:predicted aspartyl protease
LLSLYLTILLLLCAAGTLLADEERLWLDSKINGRNARLVFDTGTSHLVLFPDAAARLGLNFTNAPPDAKVAPGDVPAGVTEECEFSVGESTVRTRLRIVDMPAVLRVKFDGFIGWGALSDNIIEIDARLGSVYALSNTTGIPTTWTQFALQTNSDTLVLETMLKNGSAQTFLVDTGSSDGVALSPADWRRWKSGQKKQPLTLRSYYTPNLGLVVAEEGWARKLSVGPLVLTDVPVTEAKRPTDAPQYTAILGLAAIKRLDFIVDGKRGMAFLHPTKAPFKNYTHNRLGAVFVPIDIQSEDLIAHVVDGSPGEKAGIRGGDILLKIGMLDVTKWRSDPTILPLSRFWEQPPGTKLDLTLRRGTQTLKVNARLRQILPP